MGLLYMNTFYTIGPMDRVADRGVGWREDIGKFLFSMNCGVFNPCDKPTTEANEMDDEFEKRLEYKRNGQYDKVTEVMKPIVGYDFRMVDVANAGICYVDVDIHMCGSYHETCLSASQRKPIIFMCEQGKKNMPCWMFGQFKHELFFSSWDEVKEYLTKVDNGFYDTETLQKLGWRMFDYKKVYNV